jgi:hypothetical protein
MVAVTITEAAQSGQLLSRPGRQTAGQSPMAF